jgi:hypothetical protein
VLAKWRGIVAHVDVFSSSLSHAPLMLLTIHYPLSTALNPLSTAPSPLPTAQYPLPTRDLLMFLRYSRHLTPDNKFIFVLVLKLTSRA